MESAGKIRQSNRPKKNQVEIIEVKEEPKSDEDEEEIEMEIILPDIEEEDPLKIDDIEREKHQNVAITSKCTGYILWSADRRKELLKINPHMNFSEISKRLGKEWKKVSLNEKYNYRRRAIRLNEPTRKSSRPKKPKEIKDLSQFVKNRKKTTVKKIPQSKFRYALCPGIITSQKGITENPESITEAKKPVIEKLFQIKKAKFRFTAYSLWAQEVRVVLRKHRPKMSFTEISKQLSEMWKLVSSMEKYNYRRRAKRLTEKMVNTRSANDVRKEIKDDEITRVSSKGRVLSKPIKLADFRNLEDKKPNSVIKAKPSVMISTLENADGSEAIDKERIIDPHIGDKEEESQKFKSRSKESPYHNPIIDSLIGSKEKESRKLKFRNKESSNQNPVTDTPLENRKNANAR